MCNCETAYYLIASPVLVTVIGLLAAIIITRISEAIALRKKNIRKQGEALIRDTLYFGIHLSLMKASDISNYQVEAFNVKYNHNKDVVSLPDMETPDED